MSGMKKRHLDLQGAIVNPGEGRIAYQSDAQRFTEHRFPGEGVLKRNGNPVSTVIYYDPTSSLEQVAGTLNTAFRLLYPTERMKKDAAALRESLLDYPADMTWPVPSKSRVQKYYIGRLYDAVWNHENGNIYKVLIPVWFGSSELVTAATARMLCRGFVPGWLLFDD